jgi:hypothetical protein
VEVRVYTVAGRTIKRLVNQVYPSGFTSDSTSWNGRDENGDPVSTGLYLIAVIEPKRVEIKKVLAVKQ